MENSIGFRIKNAWNAFMGRSPTQYYGATNYYRQDKFQLSTTTKQTIVASIFNRIALDVASAKIRHCMLDENHRFTEEVDDGLNNCLSLEANIDQTANAFIQDVVISMFDEGCVAILPIDTIGDPETSESYDIETMRVAKIIEWYPQHVKLQAYNDRTGIKQEKVFPKSMVAIIENPLYAVINEPNSTLQRLLQKMRLMDLIDEKNGSGKLDVIIQLPYTIRSQSRKKQAEDRIKAVEDQLVNSKYGIAYADATEHITQLNRSVENNLFAQVEYLTSMLYSQLGITQSILDGTADEKTMLNYYSRTVAPILSAISVEIKRKFLSKNARTRGHSIEFFKDPFSLVPVSEISEIADKFTRNEIMTSNEIRQVIGMKPSDDPNADVLRNKNLSAPTGQKEISEVNNKEEEIQNEGET
jgi:hypothetical protein